MGSMQVKTIGRPEHTTVTVYYLVHKDLHRQKCAHFESTRISTDTSFKIRA